MGTSSAFELDLLTHSSDVPETFVWQPGSIGYQFTFWANLLIHIIGLLGTFM